MGAFNTVTARWTNLRTGTVHDIRVQFKYGEAWQYEYRVGDTLEWGGNDIGSQEAEWAVVDGCLESASPPLPEVPEDYEVHIVSGRIETVVPATGRYDFVSAEETFIILRR